MGTKKDQTENHSEEMNQETNDQKTDHQEAGQQANRRRSIGFKRGFAIYMACLYALVAVGLIVLWMRMDIYEKSRPDRTLEAYMAAGDSSYWRTMLLEKGVEQDYVDTLDLGNAYFHKKYGVYTDDAPVYGISFGGKEMINVVLSKGRELAFGYNEWEIGSVDLAGSRLCIYAPWDATVLVDGKDARQEFPVEEDAQDLELCLFDENAKEVRGLSKYQLDTVYLLNRVAVQDENGTALELSDTSGTSYYYVPFTNDYEITVPTGSSVTVNGIALTGENASQEERALEDFEGLEKFVSAVPRETVYTLEGLVMQPEIAVQTAGGAVLEGTADGTKYRYDIPQEELTAELSRYVMTVFDAYIAYSGNRGGNTGGNYGRYMSYVAPGSEASERAAQAQKSLVWVSGRDRRLRGSEIAKYTPYSDELFTCQINFTMDSDKTENANSYLFVFVKYQGNWKLAKVLNKTSYHIV